ncbi:uncharacterized protein BDR25DRAFT_24904 [Lindgomyces ingoldianus]|uniref:Uncharacterized protein n=1 Tax=Lindgomyces ingoldianus TaxID=673940 RepID=A0ACB6QXJ6_9PLEO|nr:uncharacterized protein BDR25DRAFT_24904 [Lindgomyces ingoldianus]KAF2471235.1 hypothetical protein BDR25DRAFT_24904 [Lindgomyces ingoldianus]
MHTVTGWETAVSTRGGTESGAETETARGDMWGWNTITGSETSGRYLFPPSTPPSPSNAGATSISPKVGAPIIVGTVLGGVVGILLLSLGLWVWRRQRKKMNEEEREIKRKAKGKEKAGHTEEAVIKKGKESANDDTEGDQGKGTEGERGGNKSEL